MADFEVLKKLIQMVKDEDVSCLSIEEKGIKYEVRRERAPSGPVTQPVSVSIPSSHSAPAAKEPSEEAGLLAITSPMVGTFYRSPSPEAPPFVNIGDEVEPGKVVCIVEAMKLFNEIESDIRGKIVKILAENGKPVEYGQKLFLVKKG